MTSSIQLLKSIKSQDLSNVIYISKHMSVNDIIYSGALDASVVSQNTDILEYILDYIQLNNLDDISDDNNPIFTAIKYACYESYKYLVKRYGVSIDDLEYSLKYCSQESDIIEYILLQPSLPIFTPRTIYWTVVNKCLYILDKLLQHPKYRYDEEEMRVLVRIAPNERIRQHLLHSVPN